MSSLWAQLCFPQGEAGQSARAASVPSTSRRPARCAQPKRLAVGRVKLWPPTAQLPADHGRVPQVPAIAYTRSPSVPHAILQPA